MRKTILTLALITMMIVPVFALTLTASAQTNADNMLWGGYEENTRAQTGLGNGDPRATAGSIIKVLLGFLGLIAVVLILLGGFKWMTAAGNEDKIAEAKKVIAAGIVGLVIIMMAFAIAQFVINALYEATNATG